MDIYIYIYVYIYVYMVSTINPTSIWNCKNQSELLGTYELFAWRSPSAWIENLLQMAWRLTYSCSEGHTSEYIKLPKKEEHDRTQGLVNVPMFHITQLLGLFHLQQIFGDWWCETNPQGTSIPTPDEFKNMQPHSFDKSSFVNHLVSSETLFKWLWDIRHWSWESVTASQIPVVPRDERISFYPSSWVT